MTSGAVWLYSAALFLAASLSFLIQPMAAKAVLPYYGGSTGVWTTCMLFFQVGLLGAYAYSHAAPKWFGLRRQAALHLAFVIVVVLILAWAGSPSWSPIPALPPSLSLLAALASNVGLPFLAVAGTAPLLQRWFGETRHRLASDPYFLYAASNAGSLAALLAYPLIIERLWSIPSQRLAWQWGLAVLAALLIFCAITLWRSGAQRELESHPEQAEEPMDDGRAPLRDRVRWTALAFIPSSLLLSVTTYLTTDVAAIPLLWVVPFVVYLATYIVAFALSSRKLFSVCSRILPAVILFIAILLLSEGMEPPLWASFGLHLIGLAVIGLTCHLALALSRPPVSQLTDFYLWLAVGGALGGAFNALLAPGLFVRTGLTEYPIVLILACLARPIAKPINCRELIWRDVLPAQLVGLLTATLTVAARWMPSELGPLRIAVAFGIPAIVCYTLVDRPVRFTLGVAALFLAGSLYAGELGRTVFLHRTFYGIHRITRDSEGKFLRLGHGNTVHGQQTNQASGRHEPLSYYHLESPIGGVMKALNNSSERLSTVGVAGLGAGTIAYYAEPGQLWTYLEIDPAVVEIAKTKFSFLPESKGDIRVSLGDARLLLMEAVDQRFDLLVIDAFSSDSIPVHLLTKEALALYVSRLSEDGLIAFHISNRHLDLTPVIAALAHESGLTGRHWYDTIDRFEAGAFASHWVLVGRPSARMDEAVKSGPWEPLPAADRRYLWTDNYSNLFSVVR